MGNTATIVTTGSIQEIAKYNIYNLYICAMGNIVSRLQAKWAKWRVKLINYSLITSLRHLQIRTSAFTRAGGHPLV